MTLEEARGHVGELVVYTGSGELESGVITRVTERFVFVLFGSDNSSTSVYADDLALEMTV